MSIGDPYITAAELKSYLQIQDDIAAFDERLADAVASASREVEQFCGRQFNKADTATPRSYEIDRRTKVYVDDFWTDAGLVVEEGDGRTWQPIDSDAYTLAPHDGIVDGLPWPYYRLEFYSPLTPSSRYSTRRLRVTAQWGWPAVPATIRQAVFQVAAQTYRLADAPLGVTGSTQYGGVVRLQDLPQVTAKLRRYKSEPILVG